MKLACCIWALTLPEKEALNQMKALGFEWIDIQPHMLSDDETLAYAKNLGLKVSCISGTHGMPSGTSLDHTEEKPQLIAVEHVKKSIDHANRVGASVVYIVPPVDDSPSALDRFSDSIRAIADHARTYGIKVAIEHFPGTAFPTALGTIDYIEQLGHDNVYLLMDSGHLQMSEEDPAAVISDAGDRLGYVHLDDNDGKNDLHWALMDGVMTPDWLQVLMDMLEKVEYDGMVSLELSPKLDDPAKALADSVKIINDL